ncbi:glycosyltransferase family protein [Georgenia sp. SUBG003]|uniref:glycosyltransferase family protein n=1 Tax=Georgenia sp. SUBG003 TaxID=1497974 RepID=UPI003AB438A5
MFAPWTVPERTPRRPVRAAVVLDDFSRLAFRFEWQQIEVTPDGWREQLADGVDLLFVESAWHGTDGAWQYHLTGPTAPREPLRELVAWCRAQGVPTVFWNKEDPVHYADFLPAARLFDHVLTTDVTRLPDYVRDLGHERVGVLPFAAQPAIHNPVRPGRGHQERDVAFAGTYFADKFPERRAHLDLLLGAAAAAGDRMEHGLEIFSRFLGGEDRYQFPRPLSRRVVGSLDYSRMLSAYRAYKVFLNVNTVTESPSMCARRILEVTASGTPVVTTPARAVVTFLPEDAVAVVSEQAEAANTVRALVRSPELRDRMTHLGQRRIWSRHTYAHRADHVLDIVGIEGHRLRRPSVSILAATARPSRLGDLLATAAAQVDVTPELVLLTHGYDVRAAEVRARAADLGLTDVEILTAGRDVLLGECLNRLVRAASGDVVAKMDDDDRYGRHYLSDQLHALDFSGADVVGKQAHYLHLASRDVTIVRYPEREHRFTDLVTGPTIVTRREVAAAHPFPVVGRGEDTGFLRGAVRAGARVYSADRFSFVQVRSAAGHTWDVSDAELLAGAHVHHYGLSLTHVMIEEKTHAY